MKRVGGKSMDGSLADAKAKGNPKPFHLDDPRGLLKRQAKWRVDAGFRAACGREMLFPFCRIFVDGAAEMQ